MSPYTRFALCAVGLPFIAFREGLLDSDEHREDLEAGHTMSFFAEVVLLAVTIGALWLSGTPLWFIVGVTTGIYLFYNTMVTVLWIIIFRHLPLL